MPKRERSEQAGTQPAPPELVLREFEALLDRKPPSKTKFMIGGQLSKESIYRVRIKELGESYIIYPNDNIPDTVCVEVNLPDHDPVVLAKCMTEHWDDIDGLKKRDVVKMFKALRDKKVIII